MNGYELSRIFWDFAFANPQKIKPYHAAIYFYAIEHCNRLGWKESFGFPTLLVLESTGIKSYSSYKRYFDDLVEFGFFEVKEYSKNQYSSNIIALTFKEKANDKALDKALVKQIPKQVESTIQSTDQSKYSINKPLTIEPINKETIKRESDFENSVLAFFGFSEFPHHVKQQRLLSQFCCAKIISGEYEYFKTQFKDYSTYIVKAKKQQYQQSLYTFLGDQSQAFQDGKWNS